MLAILSLLLPLLSAEPVALNFDVLRGSSAAEAVVGARAGFQKRDLTAEVELVNEQTFYLTNILVGTPGQNVGVLVDTGSSDLWIMDAVNPFCIGSSNHQSYLSQKLDNAPLAKPYKHSGIAYKQLAGLQKRSPNTTATATEEPSPTHAKNLWSDINSFITGDIGGGGSPFGGTTYTITQSDGGGGGGYHSYDDIQPSATLACNVYGTFDESKSSLFHLNKTAFQITYGDTTFAAGTWAYDDVKFGSISVNSLSFALANETNSTMGVLGVGLQELETTYASSLSIDLAYTYLNLPAKMVLDGIIKRNVYLLYLNKLTALSGTILFGGVDHSKYSGTLQTVAVVNTLALMGYNRPVKFEVTLSSISVSKSSGSKEVVSASYPALLDSGTTLVYMPASMIDRIANLVGAKYSSRIGYYTIDCSTSNVNVTFNFTGATIEVPVSNFILYADGSNIASGSKGSTCMLGLLNSGENAIILGDSFLSAAYVVYDLDNYQVSMAQAKYGDTTSNIEEIGSGSVPSAVSAPQYSATYAGSVLANTARLGAEATSTSSSSSSSSSSSDDKKNGSVTLNVSLLWMIASFALGLAYM